MEHTAKKKPATDQKEMVVVRGWINYPQEPRGSL